MNSLLLRHKNIIYYNNIKNYSYKNINTGRWTSKYISKNVYNNKQQIFPQHYSNSIECKTVLSSSALSYNEESRDINSLLKNVTLPITSYGANIITSTPIFAKYYNDNNSVKKYISPSGGVLTVRYFSLSGRRYEQASSKVEETVQCLKEEKKKKDKEKEIETIVNACEGSGINKEDSKVASSTQEKAVVKKSIKQKILDELAHYYHGFRLLVIDINVCRKLLWRVLNGKTLTRREHRLLIRTTSDLFRLLPFSVFIIVPFMEFLLPVAIKLFPGMLPSTFQTAKDNEEKMKQHFKVKLEMAKFLQKTLDEMAVQHKDHKSEAAKEFSEFFTKLRTTGGQASHDEILKFSKVFQDEITLDSLNRQQLAALCRVLEIGTLGTNSFLRFQLRLRLRNLAADDRMIQKEGIDSLNLNELQSACRARGMRAYGLPEARLRQQLQEWIHLSLNEKVPPSLLLLSQALMLPEDVPTSDKLKATISILPEWVATQTKAAIGEREGKIDNKTKIEIIKEEERKILEERDEEKAKQKELEQEKADILLDKAPIVTDDRIIKSHTVVNEIPQVGTEINSKDINALCDALDTLSKDNIMIVQKESIKDLKEEIADYQEDVQELHQVVTATPEKVDIKESKAAKALFKKVNKLISTLETELEKEEKKIKQVIQESPAEQEAAKKKNELVKIDELILAIKKIQQVPDDSRILQIEKILGKFDDDHDGHIRIEDVLKVIETIGKENVNLNEKQIDELIELMAKEEILDAENKIEKAIAKEIEQKELLAKEIAVSIKESVEAKGSEKIIQEVTDKLMGAQDEKHILKPIQSDTEEKDTDESSTSDDTKKLDETLETKPVYNSDIIKEVVERQTEKILPSDKNMPLPPIPPNATNNETKDKML